MALNYPFLMLYLRGVLTGRRLLEYKVLWGRREAPVSWKAPTSIPVASGLPWLTGHAPGAAVTGRSAAAFTSHSKPNTI